MSSRPVRTVARAATCLVCGSLLVYGGLGAKSVCECPAVQERNVCAFDTRGGSTDGSPNGGAAIGDQTSAVTTASGVSNSPALDWST